MIKRNRACSLVRESVLGQHIYVKKKKKKDPGVELENSCSEASPASEQRDCG